METPQTIPLIEDEQTALVIKVTPKLISLANCLIHAREHVHIECYKMLFCALRVMHEILGVPRSEISDGRIVNLPSYNVRYFVLIGLHYPGLLPLHIYIKDAHMVDDLFEILELPGLSGEAQYKIKDYLASFPVIKLERHIRGCFLQRRARNHTDLLVDPWTVSTTYVGQPQGEHFHSCVGFTKFGLPEIGQEQICSVETFRKRFDVFTHEIFDENFPWEDTWIAGGILKLLQYSPEELPASDVDIFMSGDDTAELRARVQSLLEWFEEKIPIYGKLTMMTQGSVVFLSFANLPRIFNIIPAVRRPIYSVLCGFDTSNSMWCCFGHPLEVYAHISAIKALRTRVSTLSRVSSKQANRCIKSLRYGYHLSTGSLVEAGIHYEELLEAREEVCKEIDLVDHRADPDDQIVLWTQKYGKCDPCGNSIDLMGKLETTIGITRSYTKQNFADFDFTTIDVGKSTFSHVVKSRNNVVVRLTVEDVRIKDTGPWHVTFYPIYQWDKFVESMQIVMESDSKLIDFTLPSDVKYFDENGGMSNQYAALRGDQLCNITFTIFVGDHGELELLLKSIQTKNGVEQPEASSDESSGRSPAGRRAAPSPKTAMQQLRKYSPVEILSPLRGLPRGRWPPGSLTPDTSSDSDTTSSDESD